MMDDYGTEVCCGEVAALKAEIARLEDIIAQMSGELTDAYMARDEADRERSGIATRAAYWQEMYRNTSEALRKTGDRLLEAIDGGAL